MRSAKIWRSEGMTELERQYECCPECGQDIDITDAYDGDVVACPECHTRYRVSADEDGYGLSEPLED